MSFEMNQDMFIEVLSRSRYSVVEKVRLLNKECNKRTSASWFLKLNLQRTNSISGYFLQYSRGLTVHTTFAEVFGNKSGGTHEVSLDFLPQGRARIQACDASHGILLCVNDRPVRGGQPEYIICKPTTKQHLILPNPKTRYFTISLGLMVIESNPFRYKILRLSDLPYAERRSRRRNTINTSFVCEVFDSDSYAWKRLKNLELPADDMLSYWNFKPTSSYGFLHWLTRKNVFRFCFKTETWSYCPVPESIRSSNSLDMTRYEGKLGIITSRKKEGVDYDEIWVLESIFGTSWVNVKEIAKDVWLKTVGFLTSDVVTLGDMHRICLYDMDNGSSQDLQIRPSKFSPCFFSTIFYFPLYSDFERVDMNRRFNGSDSDSVKRTSHKQCERHEN